MPNSPASNESLSPVVRKPSCSVCWEDFRDDHELEDHISSDHPDRVRDQLQIFARAS